MNARSLRAVGVALLLAACQPTVAETVELTTFGAASLSDVLATIEEEYEADAPGIDLVIATDSSTALRTQIEEGAPADVFLSADTANPAALVEGELAREAVEFAANTIALVVPVENPAGIESPADLATAGAQIIAAGPEVPITGYVTEVVANLAAMPDYPAAFADAYAANVVSQEDNVSGVLAKIELGEGDAGFVYQTDARASSEVLLIPIPEEANVHAVYAGCVTADSRHGPEATAFLDWLAGPEGQSILAEYGFVAP